MDREIKTGPAPNTGIQITRAGHLRYTTTSNGLRNKYVHRVVVDILLEETPYSLKLFIPWPYEVHHLDFNKKNCSPENLLLLDVRFHSIITADGQPRRRGTFTPRYSVDAPFLPNLDEEAPF